MPPEIQDTLFHRQMRAPTAFTQVKLYIQAAKAGHSFALRRHPGFLDTAFECKGLRRADSAGPVRLKTLHDAHRLVGLQDRAQLGVHRKALCNLA